MSKTLMQADSSKPNDALKARLARIGITTTVDGEEL